MGAVSAFEEVIFLILVIFISSVAVMTGLIVWGKIEEVGIILGIQMNIGTLDGVINIIVRVLAIIIMAIFIIIVTGEVWEWIKEGSPI